MRRDTIEHIDHGSTCQGSCGFTKNVISLTHFLKTGNSDPSHGTIDTRPFADQKAKKINLNVYSFPVYIIRKPRQRSSISDVEGGVKPPYHETYDQQ